VESSAILDRSSERGERKLRIAFATTQSDSVGGSHIHVRDVSAALRARGHEVQVFIGGSGPYLDQLSDLGVPYHKLRHMVRPIRPNHDFKAVGELAEAIRDFAPDIISSHSSKAGIIARLAGRKLRIPTLFTAHGWSFAVGVPTASRLVYENVERSLGLISNRIICVAEADRRLGISRRIVPESKLVTIHNGMPDSPERAKPEVQPPRIVSVARLDDQKDHPTLFRALQSLTDLDWRLDLVGGGPRRDEFEAMVQQLGIADRVSFHGVLTNVKPVLADSQCFVLPSNWEGFPRSTIEAMRTGLPAIVSDVGGAREAIEEGDSGFVVPAKDIDALSARLRTVISDPELRRRMGTRARKLYEERFRFDTMLDKTLGVYYEMLAANA
jgi:glycosyltransferase involved in cell wall biosynthesis